MIEIPKIFCYGGPEFMQTIRSLKFEQADFASAFNNIDGDLSRYKYGMILREENGIQRLQVDVNPIMEPGEVWRNVPYPVFIEAIHKVYDALQKEQWWSQLKIGDTVCINTRTRDCFDKYYGIPFNDNMAANEGMFGMITDIKYDAVPISGNGDRRLYRIFGDWYHSTMFSFISPSTLKYHHPPVCKPVTFAPDLHVLSSIERKKFQQLWENPATPDEAIADIRPVLSDIEPLNIKL